MTTPMPMIHLNGSSAESLEKQYLEAMLALDAAIEKFNKIDFHGRDYYVISPDAYEKARVTRAEQSLKLTAVIEYLERHIIHIQNQTK